LTSLAGVTLLSRSCVIFFGGLLGALCASACATSSVDSPAGAAAAPGNGGSGAFATGASAGTAGSMTAGNAAVAGVANAGGQPGLPLSNTPLAFAMAACDRLFDCCSPGELAMLVAGSTEQDCTDAYQASLELDVAEYTAAVAARRALYDGVMFQTCLDDYGSRECQVLRESDKIQCFDAVRPQVALGFSCGAHFECIDGYCDGGSGAATPDGTCAQRKLNGAVCSEPEECESRHCDVIAGCADAPPPAGLCKG
jgi:hypothetical protein